MLNEELEELINELEKEIERKPESKEKHNEREGRELYRIYERAKREMRNVTTWEEYNKIWNRWESFREKLPVYQQIIKEKKRELQLQDAIEEMNNATTLDQAIKIWKKWQPFQKVDSFKQIKEDKKKELSN